MAWKESKKLTQEKALRMKLLPTYTTSAEFHLWPMQHLIILTAVNSLSTKEQTDSSSKLSESKYPAQIIKAYKKGGNPSLDGDYTVFGQVIDSMDIVDSYESETDENNKPKNEIKIQKIKK